jgi:hypothetical protein
VKDFHARCDGSAGTLTVILDLDGNVFGGFTPVEWSERLAYRKKRSWLFMLKNPHNIPGQRFDQTSGHYPRLIAIRWNPYAGPDFGDIYISDGCNEKADSGTYNFGTVYLNNIGMDGMTFFTGSARFTVKEIEVFKICD